MRRPTAHVHASRCGCLFGHMHGCSHVTVLLAATASTRRAQQMEFARDAGVRPAGGRRRAVMKTCGCEHCVGCASRPSAMCFERRSGGCAFLRLRCV
jgi:hypothetical protein